MSFPSTSLSDFWIRSSLVLFLLQIVAFQIVLPVCLRITIFVIKLTELCSRVCVHLGPILELLPGPVTVLGGLVMVKKDCGHGFAKKKSDFQHETGHLSCTNISQKFPEQFLLLNAHQSRTGLVLAGVSPNDKCLGSQNK